MRRLRYQVAVSLDGFIAAADGSFDWIPTDPDIGFDALSGQFDTYLMGRGTYETSGAMLSGQRVVVASTTLDPAQHADVTIIGDNLAEHVAALKAEPGKDIWLFGGGQLFRSLLAENLVDTVEPAIVPVLLGGGVAFLPDPAVRARLELTGHRVYERSGIVLLEYAVRPGSA